MRDTRSEETGCQSHTPHALLVSHRRSHSFPSPLLTRKRLTSHSGTWYPKDLKPGSFSEFYPAFKKGLAGSHKQTKNWKAQSIFAKIDRKASNRIYHQSTGSSSSGTRSGQHPPLQTQVSQSGSHNNILEEHSCLVVGGGPCGLRTAIELQLLGAPHVLVIEKRDRYSRNNVLHLWPFVITDLKQMAGKKFYGKFCAGESLLLPHSRHSIPDAPDCLLMLFLRACISCRRYPGRYLLPLLSLLPFHDWDGSTSFRYLLVNAWINMLTLTTSLVGICGTGNLVDQCMHWVYLMMPICRILRVMPVPETDDAAHVHPFV